MAAQQRERAARERGVLVHNIAVRLPLDRVAEAHELVEPGRVIGNVVVEIG